MLRARRWRQRAKRLTGWRFGAAGKAQTASIERKLRLVGVKVERAGFFRLSKNCKLSEELMTTLVREADLAEARFAIP